MSGPLIIPEGGSHWYYRDGRSCYELPMKTRPGEMRTPTVKDARELDLVPSVTSILGVIHKPALEAWKAQQYVLSALTLPKLPTETQDAFAYRVVRDAQLEGQRAADFGTNIHKMVEEYLNNQIDTRPVGALELGFLEGFMKWCHEHKVSLIGSEMTFATDDYGGCVDFLGYVDGVFVVVDWKTQKTQPGKGVNFYSEWQAQLDAYRHGLREPEARCLSVVISSTEPGRVESFMWMGDWGMRVFNAAKEIFYSPSGRGWGLKRESDK